MTIHVAATDRTSISNTPKCLLVRVYLPLLAVLTIQCARPSFTSSTAAPSVFEGTLGDSDKAPEVSTAELQTAMKDPNVVVFDARAPEEFAVSHVPGARNVPGKPGLSASLYTADVNALVALVPDKSQRLVLYCNGPFCGRSKRLAADLVAAGYTNVRRYQLGIPMWRTLGGATQIEKEALERLVVQDQTAVLIDAREGAGPAPRLRGARGIPLRDTSKAKDDGRLPMTDHATRIFVVGDSGLQARAVADAIFHDAFQNVSFFDGKASDLSELGIL